jgi:Icc-related predicted phosphoesterase
VFTWGNHDHIGEWPAKIPKFPNHVHLLNNSSVTIDGVKFYGYPWTPRFFNWAFNVDRDSVAEEAHMALIPDDTRVLVSHGPPEFCGDLIGSLRVGSAALARRARMLPNLDLLVCGHVHAGAGAHRLVRHDPQGLAYFLPVINASRVDEGYRPVHRVHEFDLKVLTLASEVT